MNCSTCGELLPQNAANCPQCGAVTPYAYAYTNIAPNDPTVVLSPYSEPTDVQQPPPTMYGSPAFPNPYDDEPLAPPPPSPKRSANPISIIVVVALLILLLIGGSVFALLTRSLGNTATNNATPSVTSAVQHFTAKGTATIVDDIITSSHKDGQNTINNITEHVISYGDIAGTFTNQETSIVYADKTTSYSGNSTCICTVNGKSDTLTWSFSGTSATSGYFKGQFFDIRGTGNLAKLHGQGTFQGPGPRYTYTSELYFDA